ncbi:Uncharacterised protein [uncultured archaeon]|nr:Uncharacterised protein [uncultured archaeon]
MFVCAELSGCNQISNVFLTDKNKLIGTWNSEGIWMDAPTVIVFSSNSTFKLTIDFSIIKTTSDGKWNMHNGILTMEIINEIPPTNYTYQFSEDSRTLTLTTVNSSASYILTKQ